MISDGPLDSKGVRFAVEFVACQLLAVSHVFVGLLAAAAIVGMLGISGKPAPLFLFVTSPLLSAICFAIAYGRKFSGENEPARS
jgi:hypothetical protein